MFTFNDIANFLIQTLSASSDNVNAVKDELRKVVVGERNVVSEDLLATLHFLRKATHLASVLTRKHKYVKLYDLKTAQKLNLVETETYYIPALLFKIPDLPLCYVNEGIVKLLQAVLYDEPNTSYRITFKPNFTANKYYTIVRFKKSVEVLKIALRLKLKATHHKNMTLVYI